MTSITRTATGFTVTDTAAVTVTVVLHPEHEDPTRFAADVWCQSVYAKGPMEIISSTDRGNTAHIAYIHARDIARRPSIW